MKNLLAIEFMSILPYIIVAVMLIAFVVIVIVAIKKNKKPNTYVPDEVDRTVDEAAQQKAQEEQPSEGSPIVQAEPEENNDETEAENEDEDEEITFEADDVDDDEPKDDKEDKKDAPKSRISYRIMYDKETKTWEIRKDMAKRVIRRVKTKKEALEIAQELSKNQDLNLIVHKKDGKFQKKDSWSRNLSNNDEDK